MATLAKSSRAIEQLVLWASSRTEGSYASPQWEFPVPYRPDPDERVVLSLDSWVFPNRLPLLTSSNNTFDLVEDPGGGGEATFNITLTAGDFSNIRLLNTEIQTQLNAAGATNTYAVAYSTITEKVTVTATAGGEAFNLTFASAAAGSIAHYLGFSALVNTAAAGALTGTNRIDLFGDKVAILQANGLPGVQTYNSGSGKRSNTIAVVPLTSPAGHLQVFKASHSKYRVQMPVGVPLDNLRLAVKDQNDGALVVDWEWGATFLVSFERVER